MSHLAFRKTHLKLVWHTEGKSEIEKSALVPWIQRSRSKTNEKQENSKYKTQENLKYKRAKRSALSQR